jgi:tetratricopeptide (TPR) repeat protein
VRDVAYGEIPRAARADKHAAAAAWIESLGHVEDHAESIAHHYVSALELAKAAGHDASGLDDRARHAFRNAGDHAAALFTSGTALEFYERALELWPLDDPERGELHFRCAEAGFQLDRRQQPLVEVRDALLAAGNSERAAEAEMLLALALYAANDDRRALEHAARAAAMEQDAPTSRTKAFVLANQARLLAVTYHHEEAISIGRDALALAEELALNELRANALNTIGMARVMGLDDVAGLDDLEQSLQLALDHCSPFELARVYNNLAWGYVVVGRLPEAREIFETRLANAQHYGMQADVGFGAAMLCVNSYLWGDWDATVRLADELLADPLMAQWHGPALIARATIRLGRNELPGASVDVQAALELTVDTDDVEARTWLLALGVRVALAAGRPSDTEALVGELEMRLGDDVMRDALATPLFELARALHALGRPLDPLAKAAASRPERVWNRIATALAQGRTAEAVELLVATGAATYAAHFRLLLADEHAAAGRASDAATERERAVEFFRSVGATRYVREGRVALGRAAALPG